MAALREAVEHEVSARTRIVLMDLITELKTTMMLRDESINTLTRAEHLTKMKDLVSAVYAVGLLSRNEYDGLSTNLDTADGSLSNYRHILGHIQRATQWAVGSVR